MSLYQMGWDAIRARSNSFILCFFEESMLTPRPRRRIGARFRRSGGSVFVGQGQPNHQAVIHETGQGVEVNETHAIE